VAPPTFTAEKLAILATSAIDATNVHLISINNKMGESRRRKQQDPSYGQSKFQEKHLDLIDWLIAGEGVLIIPEIPQIGSTEVCFRASYQQLTEDKELLNIDSATQIARQANTVALGVRRWLEIGEGFMGLIDRDAYEAATGVRVNPGELFVFNWYKTAELRRIFFSEEVRHLIDRLIDKLIAGQSYPCLFQSVPVGAADDRYPCSVLLMVDKAKLVESGITCMAARETFA
jgi:hypothetical protein